MTTTVAGLATVAERAAEVARDGVRICRPGVVRAFDAAASRADVDIIHQEMRTRQDGTVEVVTLPRLYGLPVAQMSGAGSSLTIGLSPGDQVWVVFRDQSGDEYDAGRTTGPYAPQDPSRFRPRDGVVWPFASAPARMDGAPVIAMPAGRAFRVGSLTAGEGVAMAAAVEERLSAIEVAIQTLILPVAGAVAGPPVPPPVFPGTALASLRLLTDDTVVPGTGVVP
jgi:hypothetical protein